MAITPYRPAPDLIESMLGDFFRPMAGWGGRMGGLVRMPEADVRETEREIRVTAELPGMKPEDVELALEHNVLTISGEKKEERQGNEDTWHLSERRYGRFSRSFILPRDVDQDRIEARFEDGVLTVTIPKSEGAQRRRIEIQGGGGAKRVDAGRSEND